MALIEHVAANVADLPAQSMRQVELGKHRVLLVHADGRLHALGGTCPHYGAPLAEGTLCGHRVICPWHQSVFDVRNGRFLEPPTLDNIPVFPHRVIGGKILVSVPDDAPDRVSPVTVAPPWDSHTSYGIIGAGAAGVMAAQTLRAAGFGGWIYLVSPERRLPYDRPNLSKEFMQGAVAPGAMLLRDESFYTRNNIERVGRQVDSVDVRKKVVSFAGGAKPMEFDALLLATGCRPKRLELPGADLRNVFTLRSYEDCEAIVGAALHAARAVVVGSSFIAMEVAASLVRRGVEVSVVGTSQEPFEKVLGMEIGRRFRKLHESHGVHMHMRQKVARLEGQEIVQRVVLADGTVLPAELVVAGIGVSPETDFIYGAQKQEDGGLRVDHHLRVAPDVFAAGDIAAFPDPRTGRYTRIEHWRTAEQMGMVAAMNMRGEALPFTSVPYFWTFQFDVGLDYVGHASQWERIIYDGDLEKPEFMAYFVDAGRVVAAAGANRTHEAAAFAELLRLGQVPPVEAFDAGHVDLVSRMREAAAREG